MNDKDEKGGIGKGRTQWDLMADVGALIWSSHALRVAIMSLARIMHCGVAGVA